MPEHHCGECFHKQAEIERLREALKRICVETYPGDPVYDIARAALEKK